MKQFTTPDQTAKLIELGVENPKSISSIKVTGDIITTADDLIGGPSSVMGGKITANYSIGELIEILNRVDDEKLEICRDCGFWLVGTDLYCTTHRELVDALFDMIVLLKEEGVI